MAPEPGKFACPHEARTDNAIVWVGNRKGFESEADHLSVRGSLYEIVLPDTPPIPGRQLNDTRSDLDTELRHSFGGVSECLRMKCNDNELFLSLETGQTIDLTRARHKDHPIIQVQKLKR